MDKSPKKRSDGQELFLYRLRRHRMIVCAARILILILFLLLWELCADHGIIDSFIFSSPSRIALCFWEMVLDRSIFLHIGITLYETIVSFLLVTFLRYPDRRPALVQPGALRDTGALSGGAEQPAEIRTGAASDRMAWSHPDDDHRGRYVRRRVREHHEPVHQFYHSRQRKDQTDLHPSREPQARTV